AQIAKQLRVSRPTVANLLSRARSRGIVSITPRPDLLSRLSLAQDLRVRFGLQDACIVPTPTERPRLKFGRPWGKRALCTWKIPCNREKFSQLHGEPRFWRSRVRSLVSDSTALYGLRRSAV